MSDWLPYDEWSKTPCPVPFHTHCGPTDSCRDFMERFEALGPDAIQCPRCWRPATRTDLCPVCGRDPKPRVVPGVRFVKRRVGEYEADGVGCVERVHPSERAFYEDGPY